MEGKVVIEKGEWFKDWERIWKPAKISTPFPLYEEVMDFSVYAAWKKGYADNFTRKLSDAYFNWIDQWVENNFKEEFENGKLPWDETLQKFVDEAIKYKSGEI